MSDDAARPSPGRGAAPSRATVLGGTGLIGAAAARRFLDDGCDVTVLARRSPDPRTAPLLAGARVVLGDARDAELLASVVRSADHVVDALGAPHPADSVHAPMAQFDAEIPILLELLDVLRRSPGVGFTYLSSGGAIYGNVAELPVSEDVDCHPISPYGVTKLAAERYVLMAADEIDARILRVANAYGPLQRPGTGQGVVAELLDAAVSGAAIHIFGDGSSVRDYVEARDIADALVRLASSGDATKILNVGTGTGHSLSSVLSIVEAVTGAPLQVVHDVPRGSDVRAVILDVARLSSVVPWHPMSLEQGVLEMWASWSVRAPESLHEGGPPR